MRATSQSDAFSNGIKKRRLLFGQRGFSAMGMKWCTVACTEMSCVSGVESEKLSKNGENSSEKTYGEKVKEV